MGIIKGKDLIAWEDGSKICCAGCGDPGEGTAGKLFKDDALYNNSNEMLVETRNLIKAIRENPKKYLSIKLHVF